METVRNIKKLKFPENTELTLDLVFKELTSTRKLKPEMLERLVEDYIIGPYSHSVLSRSQLVHLLLTFYLNEDYKIAWNQIFMFIFEDINVSTTKFEYLYSLVSYAIYLKNTNLLDAVANWMEVKGLSSDSVKKLVSKVLKDLIIKSTWQPPSIQSRVSLNGSSGEISSYLSSPLQIVSSQFICNIIIVTTMLFPSNCLEITTENCISVNIIRLICDWLEMDPFIISMPLQKSCTNKTITNRSGECLKLKNSLMSLVTWTIRSCINQKDKEPSEEELQTFRLHYILLVCINSLANIVDQWKLTILPSESFYALFHDISSYIKRDSTDEQLTSDFQHQNHENAIDLACQVLQIALSSGILKCPLNDLKKILNLVPETRLSRIIKVKNGI